MKEFELLTDIKSIGSTKKSVVSLISHYACETSMELDNEFSIDIGIGKIYIKKDGDEVMFSYSPSDDVIGAVLTGFSGNSDLLSSTYKLLDKLIVGG